MIDLVTAWIITNVCLAAGGFFLGRASKKAKPLRRSVRVWESKKNGKPTLLLVYDEPEGYPYVHVGQNGLLVNDVQFIPAYNTCILAHCVDY